MADSAPAAAPAGAAVPPPSPGMQAAPEAPTAAPAGDGAGLERARWVEARIREIPKYVMLFYNVLLDAKLPDEFKEQAFATLGYVVDHGDIIPKGDPLLDGLDDLAFAVRCMTELVGRLPQAALAIYEEVLFAGGIDLRERVMEAPKRLGKFYQAVNHLYRDRVARRAPSYKNCVKTGEIVRWIREFLAAPGPGPWSEERLRAVEAFLGSFDLKK